MKSIPRILSFLISCIFIMGCGGENTESNVEAPGDDKSTKSTVLGIGADVIQDKTPLNQINVYLDGFHFYNGHIDGQMEAHHYVTQINEDVQQAIIFDGNDDDAKIMGVEYILSDSLFRTLPDEEKKLWHSHHYEVLSGSLIAPGIPDDIEYELMEKLVSTYGKIIHTWHTDRDLELPFGEPQIMMGFTEDGQLRNELLEIRDENFGISTADKREQRKDIPIPQIDSLANAWEKGEIRQLQITDSVPDSIKNH